MLLPEDKPYMNGLNSYYLDTDKFIEHLQGEIGTGCIYFNSSVREILVYFDEMDIIGGIIQESGEKARAAATLQPVFQALTERNYIVSVFHLDPHAVFYWAQLPPYKRIEKEIASEDLSLSKLVVKLGRKEASCFVEVKFSSAVNMNCILFFNKGDFVGGSYAWGAGGLNPSRNELEAFLHAADNKTAKFAIGQFLEENLIPAEEGKEKNQEETVELAAEDQVFLTSLPILLEEYLAIYIKTVARKAKVDPVDLMQQHIVLRAEQYPFLDPFNLPFDYTNNVFTFTATDKAFGENTAKAIIECSWDVVREYRLEKKFNSALLAWDSRYVLDDRGYGVIR